MITILNNWKTGQMKKRKSKSPKKSKRAPKRRVSFSAKKRRGREMFDIVLPKGYKEQVDLESIIERAKLNFRELPDEQVKITFVASKGKKQKATMSFIYDLGEGETTKENNEQIIFSMKDMLSDIFKKKTEREATKSWQRIQPIKNYLNKIIIDFETND